MVGDILCELDMEVLLTLPGKCSGKVPKYEHVSSTCIHEPHVFSDRI